MKEDDDLLITHQEEPDFTQDEFLRRNFGLSLRLGRPLTQPGQSILKVLASVRENNYPDSIALVHFVINCPPPGKSICRCSIFRELDTVGPRHAVLLRQEYSLFPTSGILCLLISVPTRTTGTL